MQNILRSVPPSIKAYMVIKLSAILLNAWIKTTQLHETQLSHCQNTKADVFAMAKVHFRQAESLPSYSKGKSIDYQPTGFVQCSLQWNTAVLACFRDRVHGLWSPKVPSCTGVQFNDSSNNSENNWSTARKHGTMVEAALHYSQTKILLRRGQLSVTFKTFQRLQC